MITRRCERCSAPFQTHPYLIRSGNGRYCSLTCARRSRPRRDFAERFWEKVDKSGVCWVWMSGCDAYGYGQFALSHSNPGKAHRVSWELANGPIPDGMAVCHRCDNPPCVRPDHLFLAPNSANMADMKAKGRAGQRGERSHVARLNAKQVLAIRKRRDTGVSESQIAREFGVARATVADVLHRRTWAHV